MVFLSNQLVSRFEFFYIFGGWDNFQIECSLKLVVHVSKCFCLVLCHICLIICSEYKKNPSQHCPFNFANSDILQKGVDGKTIDPYSGSG